MLSAASPAGSGSTLSVHFLPFQCSAIGSCLPDPSVASPTPQQFSRPEQDTERRKVPGEPVTLGLALSDHFLPFQCSIKVRATLDAVCAPTAQHEVWRGQATPTRTRPGGWPGDAAGVAADTAGVVTASTATRAAGTAKSRIIDRTVSVNLVRGDGVVLVAEGEARCERSL